MRLQCLGVLQHAWQKTIGMLASMVWKGSHCLSYQIYPGVCFDQTNTVRSQLE